MAKMQRIFIRIDPETGDVLRRWFNSKGTTLAGAIQDFLMNEYEKALDAEPDSDKDESKDAKPESGEDGDVAPESDVELDVEVDSGEGD